MPIAPPKHTVIDPEGRFIYGLATLDQRAGRLLTESPATVESFSWDRAINIAEHEKALSVMHAACAKLPGRGGLTPEQSSRVQHATIASAMTMSNLALRLEDILAAYAAADIPVVLLKGAAFAVTVYPSFVRRPMGDLDILIQPTRAREAWQLAQSIGWTPESGRTNEAFYDAHHHLPPLLSTRWPGGLELHTALFPPHNPFNFSPDAVWRDARPAEVGKHRALVPSVPHLMLHACAHFAWSNVMRSAGWRTFRDLSWIIGTGSVDWDEFVKNARDVRASTCCYWTLRLGRRLAALDVPESVITALAPPLSAPVLRRLEQYYATCLCPRRDWREPTKQLSQMLWSLGIQPRWSGHSAQRPWRSSNVFGTGIDRAEVIPREGVGLRARQLLRELGVLIR